MADEATATAALFSAGRHVKIHGLASEKARQHNGKTAVIKKPLDEATGRCCIQTVGGSSKKILAIKPSNLTILCSLCKMREEKTEPERILCLRCKKTSYCSEVCKEKHWRGANPQSDMPNCHKAWCIPIKLEMEPPTQAVGDSNVGEEAFDYLQRYLKLACDIGNDGRKNEERVMLEKLIRVDVNQPGAWLNLFHCDQILAAMAERYYPDACEEIELRALSALTMCCCIMGTSLVPGETLPGTGDGRIEAPAELPPGVPPHEGQTDFLMNFLIETIHQRGEIHKRVGVADDVEYSLRVVGGGKTLDDARTLLDFNIQKNATLDVLVRGLGGVGDEQQQQFGAPRLWDYSGLVPGGIGAKLAAQCPALEAVQCRVDDRTVSAKDGSTLSNSDANAHNRRLCDIFRDLPRFFDDYIAQNKLTANHPALTANERAAGAMLINGITVNRDDGRQQTGASRAHVPTLTQIIYLFSENEEYCDDPNGMQRLLNHMSISNDADGSLLTGTEAYLQKVQLLHLHHESGPLGDARDASPLNTTFGNRPANLAGKSCSIEFWRTCNCPIRCLPRFYLVTPEHFEEEVKVELIKPFATTERGVTEVQIRRFYRQKYIDFCEHWEKPVPPFLLSDDLLEERYQSIAGLRLRVILSSLGPPGIECPTQGRRVTFEQFYTGQANMPAGFVATLQSQLEVLRPVQTASDPEIQAEVTKQNDWAFGRCLALNYVFTMAVQGNLTSDVRGVRADEQEVGAVFLRTQRGRTLPAGQQQLNLVVGDEWSASRAVNAYCNETGETGWYPGAPGVVKLAELYFNYHGFFRRRGGVVALLRYISVLSPAGGLSLSLVKAQTWEASHTTHLEFKTFDSARDCNPANITYESSVDNAAHAICAYDPALPCLNECECRTRCAKLLFKLDEERLLEIVNSEWVPFAEGCMRNRQGANDEVVKEVHKLLTGIEILFRRAKIFKQREESPHIVHSMLGFCCMKLLKYSEAVEQFELCRDSSKKVGDMDIYLASLMQIPFSMSSVAMYSDDKAPREKADLMEQAVSKAYDTIEVMKAEDPSRVYMCQAKLARMLFDQNSLLNQLAMQGGIEYSQEDKSEVRAAMSKCSSAALCGAAAAGDASWLQAMQSLLSMPFQ